MGNQLFTLVSCYVILHCMVAGLVLILRPRRLLVFERFEVLWLFTIAVCLIAYMMSLHQLYPSFPRMHIFRATWALLPPVMYFYIKSLTGKNPITSSWQLLHFLPFVVKCIFLTPFFLSPWVANDGFLTQIPSSLVDLFFYRTIEGRLASSIHFLVYLVLTFRVLKSYGVDLSNLLSFEQSLRIRYLRFINVLIIASYSVYSVLLIYHWISGDPGVLEGLPSPGVVIFLSFVFLNFVVLNLVSRSSEDFPKFDEKEDSSKETLDTNNKLIGENEDEWIRLKDELDLFMREEKPFLNSRLNINRLAELLSVSPRKLSKLINQAMNTNFYDYVNSYRVAEVETLFRTLNDVSLLDIAFQAGFQSKSAFNKNFLKHTGKTPTAYLKQLSKGNEMLRS
ncbi:hypothetical protein NBRC116492_09810 [Aurantivibrio infirmus]